MDCVIIDNQVVSKFMGNGIRICSINYAEKCLKMDTNNLIRIRTGSKIGDNKLLQQLSDGMVSFEQATTINN